MAQKIERKFLVNTDLWQPQTAGIKIMQCYLVRTEGMTLRLRLADEKFEFPALVTREVSGDRRYRNAYLAEHTYKSRVEKSESSDSTNKL